MEYKIETEIIRLGNKSITLQNLTPVFKNEEDKGREHEKIEKVLFRIFSKHAPI